MSSTATTSGLDDATGPQLTHDAEKAYWRLREQRTTAECQIAGLQDYIRNVRPEGLEEIYFMPKILNAKKELFCREFIVDLKAGPAAIRAGYSKKQPIARSLACYLKLKLFSVSTN